MNTISTPKFDIHPTHCAVLLAMSVGISLGCSTVASGGSDGPPPTYPSGWDSDGYIIKCQEVAPTSSSEADKLTCISYDSFRRYNITWCNEGKGIYPLYYKAICANTFGGVPSDYMEPEDGWRTEVDDYPTSDFDDQEWCDPAVSFDLSDEIPAATDAVLLSSGTYDSCSQESYCQTLAAIIAAFPSDGIAPDAWCNTAIDGDPLQPGPWVCVGSATDACGYYYKDQYPPQTEILCPGVKYEGDELCVPATSEADASIKCQALCESYNGHYLEHFGSAHYPPEGRFDCTVFGPNTMYWSSFPLLACQNQEEISPLTVTPFSFSAELLIDGGANASSSTPGNLGYIDYRVENCVGSACDIVIEKLSLSYNEYTGTLYDDAVGQFPYSVDGVSIQLLEAVRGEITPAAATPPTVSFNSQKFRVWLSTGSVVVDGISLGDNSGFWVETNQVAGYYNSGVLTLYIAYETVDSTIALALTTF